MTFKIKVGKKTTTNLPCCCRGLCLKRPKGLSSPINPLTQAGPCGPQPGEGERWGGGHAATTGVSRQHLGPAVLLGEKSGNLPAHPCRAGGQGLRVKHGAAPRDRAGPYGANPGVSGPDPASQDGAGRARGWPWSLTAPGDTPAALTSPWVPKRTEGPGSGPAEEGWPRGRTAAICADPAPPPTGFRVRSPLPS